MTSSEGISIDSSNAARKNSNFVQKYRNGTTGLEADYHSQPELFSREMDPEILEKYGELLNRLAREVRERIEASSRDGENAKNDEM